MLVFLCLSDKCYGRPPPSCQEAVVELPTHCPSCADLHTHKDTFPGFFSKWWFWFLLQQRLKMLFDKRLIHPNYKEKIHVVFLSSSGI